MEKQTATNGYRQIDAREYLSTLRDLTNQGESVSVLITGGSMTPFLVHLRDYIYFEKPKRPLKKGDMVFYQRKNGHFVMHRIYRIDETGYYLVGDAQTEIEGPLEESQIFALITAVKRKGKMEGPGSFWWEFFEHVWIRIIPVRGVIRRGYGTLMKVLGRQMPESLD